MEDPNPVENIDRLGDLMFQTSDKSQLLHCVGQGTKRGRLKFWERRISMIYLCSKYQGVSCDPFLRRTHAPCTSRFWCARTRVRNSNLRWSHFAPAPVPFINQHFFLKIFSKFSTFYKLFYYKIGHSKAEKNVPKQKRMFQSRKGCSKPEKDVPKQKRMF